MNTIPLEADTRNLIDIDLTNSGWKFFFEQPQTEAERKSPGRITLHRGYQTKLKNFRKTVSDYCQERGYI